MTEPAASGARPGLSESDERFRALADCALDAFVTIDVTGRVLDWNHRAEELFGWSQEEVAGELLTDLIVPPQYREQQAAGLERFSKTGAAPVLNQQMTLSAITRDGRELPIALSVATIESDGQNLFCAFIRDLSEQNEAERRIKRQTLEARLLQQANLLSATGDSYEDALRICVSNLGEITGWPVGHAFVRNDAGDRLVSAGIWYTADAARFAKLRAASEAASLGKGQDLPGRIWQSGEAAWITDVREDENFARGANAGELGIRSAFGFPVKVNSQILGVIEFFHHEQRAPDAHLMTLARSIGNQLGHMIERMHSEEERTRLAAIVESSADAIIGKASDGKIISWNAGAERVYGWSPDEAIGQTISLILPQGATAEEAEIAEAMEAGRRLEQFEAQRQRRDGTIVDVSITVSPIRGRDGRIVGSSTIERDITARIRRENELRAARDAAERANRTRGEFLANVSHELRTPMNAILGMLELALQDELQPVMRDYLETAKDSADSLLLLVNDILDFSRLEAGRFELDPVPFALRDLLDDAIKTLSVRAHEKGLELACHIDAGVPTHVVGDPMRLRQVVMNLAGNGIKFTEQGEVVVDVTLADRDENGGERSGSSRRRGVLQPDDEIKLLFCVSDTGIGIDPESQDRIFAPFTQADASTTRRYSGTGLGLAICHELTQLMGGKMWLQSEPGLGSRFYFTGVFKVAEPDRADSNATTSVQELRDLRVLVVDDNQTNRRILSEMLTNWHMSPLVVDSAGDALRELAAAAQRKQPFPLVIVDALMPETDGFMLLEAAQTRGFLSSATILMLSSADRQVFNDRCEGLGISAYLEKPVSQSDLLDAIMTALKGPQLESKSVAGIQQTSRTLDILVAEDTPANQKVVTAILSKRGHRTVLASNGREALECLRGDTFDVVLMDVQMPTMDGLQATAAIREEEAKSNGHIPIIAMTAHAMRGDREKCLAAGMDDYISKPIDSVKLLRLVERYTRGSNQVLAIGSEKPAPSPSTAGDGTPPELAERPLIDMQKALARVGNDADLLADMVEFFFADAPSLLAEINTHLQAGEAEELARAAHSLKGLCANFEATVAADAAREVENMGNRGEVSAAVDAVLQLELEFAKLTDELARWQSQSTTRRE